jgi:hypothetical protein
VDGVFGFWVRYGSSFARVQTYASGQYEVSLEDRRVAIGWFTTTRKVISRISYLHDAHDSPVQRAAATLYISPHDSSVSDVCLDALWLFCKGCVIMQPGLDSTGIQR